MEFSENVVYEVVEFSAMVVFKSVLMVFSDSVAFNTVAFPDFVTNEAAALSKSGLDVYEFTALAFSVVFVVKVSVMTTGVIVVGVVVVVDVLVVPEIRK